MNILQIVPELDIGGAEKMIETLSIELHKMGHNVEVVSLRTVKTDITINLKNNGINVNYMGKKLGLDVSMFSKLYKLFKQFKPDVIHSHRHTSQYVMPAAIAAKIPCRVHTIHSMADKDSLIKPLQNFFFKFCGLKPVGISEIVKDSICSFYKLSPSKVELVYNGVDFSKCIKKTNYDITDGCFRFVHVARFVELKNQKGIIQAFYEFKKTHSNSELYLIGDGPMFKEINNYVKEHHLNNSVFLLGMINNVPQIISQYDCFLLISKYEGLPISIIEAMGDAMPIVASNVGGIPNILQDNFSALLCDTSSDSIIKTMEKIFSDNSLRERIGKNAFIGSKKFSANNMAKRYIEIYKHEVKRKCL